MSSRRGREGVDCLLSQLRLGYTGVYVTRGETCLPIASQTRQLCCWSFYLVKHGKRDLARALSHSSCLVTALVRAFCGRASCRQPVVVPTGHACVWLVRPRTDATPQHRKRQDATTPQAAQPWSAPLLSDRSRAQQHRLAASSRGRPQHSCSRSACFQRNHRNTQQ